VRVGGWQGSNADLMERMAVLEVEAPQVIRPDQDGWLASPGDTLQLWRLLFFVLKNDVLFCFDTDVARCRGAISLTGFQVRGADTEIKAKNSIKLYHLEDGRVHFFVAQNREDAQAWLAAFLHAASQVSADARPAPGQSASPPGSVRAAGMMPLVGARRSLTLMSSVDALARTTTSSSDGGDASAGSPGSPASPATPSTAAAPTPLRPFPKSTCTCWPDAPKSGRTGLVILTSSVAAFSRLLTAAHHGTDAVVERTLLVRAELQPLGTHSATMRAARQARKPSSLASNWNLADQLVRVQLTRTLVDSQFEVYDSLSRSAALSRIMDQPAPYPRQAISDMAADLAFVRVAGFVVSRGNSLVNLFRRTASTAAAAADPYDVSLRRATVARQQDSSGPPTPARSGSSGHGGSTPPDQFETASTNGDARSTSSPPSTLQRTDSTAATTTAATSGTPSKYASGNVAAQLAAANDASETVARRRALAVLGFSPAAASADDLPSQASSGDGTAVELRRGSSGAGSAGSEGGERDSSAGGRMRQRRSTFVVRGGIPTSMSVTSFAAEMMGIQYGAALKEGWLVRSGTSGTSDSVPARLWFVLDDSSMRAYASDTSDVSVMEVDLEVRCALERVRRAKEGTRGAYRLRGTRGWPSVAVGMLN
jgi:hypothetical protein